MEPQIGQRWKWGSVTIEVTEIAPDKAWYNGVVVQNSGPGVKPGDKFGRNLHGWCFGVAGKIWTYLLGQDSPKV